MEGREEPPPPGVVVTTTGLPASSGPIIPPLIPEGGIRISVPISSGTIPATTGVAYDITPPPMMRNVQGIHPLRNTTSPWGYYTPQYQPPMTYQQQAGGWYPGYYPWSQPNQPGYPRPVQPIPFPSLDTEGTVTSAAQIPPYVPQGVPMPPLYHEAVMKSINDFQDHLIGLARDQEKFAEKQNQGVDVGTRRGKDPPVTKEKERGNAPRRGQSEPILQKEKEQLDKGPGAVPLLGDKTAQEKVAEAVVRNSGRIHVIEDDKSKGTKMPGKHSKDAESHSSNKRRGADERSNIDEKIKNAMKKYQKEGKGAEEEREDEDSPLNSEIQSVRFPSRFKLPTFEPFDGTGDPKSHISKFKTIMMLQDVTDPMLCRVFPATLKASAQKWYSCLKAGSISSFSDLASAFKARFRTNIPMQKSSSDLRKCKQGEQETLKNFVERFNKEAVQIENLNHDTAIEAMKMGTKFEELRDKILMKKPTTFQDLMLIAHKYVELDEARRTLTKQHEHTKQDSSRYRGKKEEERPRTQRYHVKGPHNDALVIEAIIRNHLVKRILVDEGSSVNLLTLEAFKEMKGSTTDLRKSSFPLVGLGGAPIRPEGTVSLYVELGNRSEGPVKKMHAQFNVVDLPLAYNSILGRPFLYQTGAVTSIRLLTLKMPTPSGIVVVRGDQEMAKECCLVTTKEDESLTIEAFPGDAVEEEESQGAEPVGVMKELHLTETKMVKVGTEVPEKVAHEIIEILKKNVESFATEPTEIVGINPKVASHKLNVIPGSVPKVQKKRRFTEERQKIIADEVNILEAADFIREVFYPEWVANVVLVKKANGKYRMCVDFTDLNKACPKDNYPLPNIDQLVDSTACYLLYSFVDAAQGYHQIPMEEKDQEKTSFVTDRGTYCYKVMPFGLKNAGATYQRLVNFMFQDQLGKNVEAYVDDIIVKSLTAEEHAQDLEETFKVLNKFGMKLNPAKCAFGVKAGKFLGYLISQRGIEANPEKIQAVIDMKAPQSVRDVQKLNGRVTALGRFISSSAKKCLPFFKQLRNMKKFKWDEDCQVAFEELKAFLTNPPLLSRPVVGETLYLYLSVGRETIASVLVREEEEEQWSIYYISRTLKGAELNYPTIDKLALAVVVTTKKLKPYFQGHTVIVRTNQPLRKALHRPETSGRLVSWSVQLGEHDIRYEPRTTLKAQALADFVAEMTEKPCDSATEELTWNLFVDGASSDQGAGAGVVLLGPHKIAIEYAVHLSFKATNNVAEYEALLTGLEIATEVKAEKLKIHSDSQLVTSQVLGQFQTKDQNMAKYMARAKEQLKKIEKNGGQWEIIPIPREENTRADAIAKAAAVKSQLYVSLQMKEERLTPTVEEQQVLPVAVLDPWMQPIVAYLADRVLPEGRTEAAKLVRISSATVPDLSHTPMV
ncbi:uncharacterized protein LOC126681656 [Mercurialis annua]|uniref:uncharacterized protein LOC126681656 n=1 Tax=Mercurialis annua TaxID=3986 RepID=UPI00215E1E96|nr:uncharacterized protein LOC126681656 [Mercurialis annua]